MITIGEQILNSATDESLNPVPNIDGAYGPYASLSAALNAISAERRAVGLTVGIKTGNNIKEYWFDGGTNNENLIAKQSNSGGGGGGESMQVEITNNVTDTTTYLNAQYPSAAIPTMVVDETLGGVYFKYSATKWVKVNGTILGSSVPATAKVVAANVLSYK